MMATDTGIASGAIANCTDGADEVPIVNWEAQARSFDGVSSVRFNHCNKNLIMPPVYDSDDISLCLDLGTDVKLEKVTMSFLATNAVSAIKNNALVDYRESDGTHHYVALSAFRNASDGTYFDSGTPQNGIYAATSSNFKFRYIYIYYCQNRWNKFSTNCLSKWQIEVGNTRTDFIKTLKSSDTAQLGRTVYGAKLNLTSGTGTENMVRVKISDLSWTYYTSGTNPIFYATNVPNMVQSARGAIPNIRIQGFNDPVIAQTRSYQSRTLADLDCSVFEDASTICFRCTAYTSRDDMIAALGDNYIIYETTQTTDFTFSPIMTPVTWGVDNFWIDCGDSEVEYYKSGYGYTSVTLNRPTSKNLFNPNNPYIEGKYVDNVVGDTITLVENTNYNIYKFYVPSSVTIQNIKANTPRWYTDDGNGHVLQSGRNNGGTTGTTFTITINSPCYLYISVGVNGTYKCDDILQLELGTSPTSYVPYSAVTKTAKLHKLVYLANVDVIRGIGSVTWDKVVYVGADNEAWLQSVYSGIYRYYIKNNDVKQPASGRGVVYSSIGTYSSSSNAVGTIFSSAYNQDTRIYYIPPQTCTTVAEFKTWLQSNNLDVTYEKATPEAFTFPPVSFDTIEGEQFLFASEGNSALTYRKAVEDA